MEHLLICLMSFGGGSMVRQSAAMTSLSVLPLGRGEVIDAVTPSTSRAGRRARSVSNADGKRRDHARYRYTVRGSAEPIAVTS